MCITFLGGPQEGRWIPPVPIIPFHFYTCFLQGEMACYVALLLHGLAAMDAFAVSSTVGGARGQWKFRNIRCPPPPQQQTGEVLWAAAQPGDRGSGVRRCKRNCVSFIGAARAVWGQKDDEKPCRPPTPFLTTWTSGGRI